MPLRARVMVDTPAMRHVATSGAERDSDARLAAHDLDVLLGELAAVSTTLARSWRLRLPVLWLFKCFLPAWLRFSLPVAVTRKRFFDALWVFILGMVAPFQSPARAAAEKERGPWRSTKGPGRSVRPAPRAR